MPDTKAEKTTEHGSKEEVVTRIMSLETTIKGYLMDVEKLQEQVKEQSAMLKDAFENDAQYEEISKKVKEVTRERKECKDRILKDPAVAELNQKVNDLRGELKEHQQALSDYLSEYFQESGMRQITGQDGEIREIVTTFQLVKKKE